MKPIKMTEEALKYKDEWVAFSPDFQRVLGHGSTPRKASAMAGRAAEESILFFIPKQWPNVLVL